MNFTCPLCNENNYNKLDVVKHDLYKCNTCQLVFKNPLNYITDSEELEVYNKHENYIDDINYRTYFKKYIDLSLIDFIGNRTKGLDFGSGIAPVLSDVLNKDYNLNFNIYDKFYCDDTSVFNEKYDIITCTEVIEHIKKPDEVLQQFLNISNEQSIISIMTLLYNNETDFDQWWYVRDESHICFYNTYTINYISEKYNLEIIFNDEVRHITFLNLN